MSEDRDAIARSLSAHISLHEACAILDVAALQNAKVRDLDVEQIERWVNVETGEPTRVETQRLRRRLRSLEREVDQKVLFGGRLGHGRGAGSKCWTTIEALRRVGLIDDTERLRGLMDGVMTEIVDRQRTLEDQASGLAHAFMVNRREIDRIKKRLGMS